MKAPQGEELLIEQIRGGDQAAWRQLIQRYEGRLLAFARARLAAHADAEDVVQETFVGFVQSLPHYDARRPLETYLFAILRFKITDLLKKRSPAAALQGTGPDLADDLLATIAGPAESPSTQARDRERQKLLAEALERSLRAYVHELKDRQKFEDLQIIELSFFVGRRNKDIAGLLEVDEKHVAGVKFRAIHKLHGMIAEACADIEGGELERAVSDLGVSEVWREGRITCLKRGTLGAYLLGILEDPWLSYAQFHLDVVGCPICVSNLEDLREEAGDLPAPDLRERIFASSVGFLSAPAAGGG